MSSRLAGIQVGYGGVTLLLPSKSKKHAELQCFQTKKKNASMIGCTGRNTKKYVLHMYEFRY